MVKEVIFAQEQHDEHSHKHHLFFFTQTQTKLSAVLRTETADTADNMPPNIPLALNTQTVVSTERLLERDGLDGDGISGTKPATQTVRISTNTIKMYVKPALSAAGYAGQWNDKAYDSTATMYYSINGGATVTIGTFTTTQVAANVPFIFLDNMVASTSYKIEVWTVLNALSNTDTNNGAVAVGTLPLAADVAADNATPNKLTVTVIVDTATPVTTITTTMAAYSNAATGTIRVVCSKAASTATAGGRVDFYVSFAGSAYAIPGNGQVATDGVNYFDYSYSLAGKTDGSYTFSAHCKFVGTDKQSDKNIRATNVNSAAGVVGLGGVAETTNPKASLTWFYDTTAPVVAVQAGPGVGGAASLFAYGAGTTSFTFSCTDENGLACTYKCALDGKATSSAASLSTASKGYYSCTSGHTITLAAGVTTTFHVYAVDLAGNESPLSPMYAYSNDNTAPLVAFTNMDRDPAAVLNTATQTSNALESFGGYYPTQSDLTGASCVNGNTVGCEYLKDGTTALYTRNIGTTTGGLNPLDDLNDATPTITTDMLYRTVLQVPIDTTDPVYDLTNNGSRGATDGYGVLLAAREVNGVTPTGVTAYGAYYYNVLLSTNSPGGKFTFTCIHNEMANGDLVGTIVTA